MSWFKLGRWVCLGIFAMTTAAACGGRGNLRPSDYEGDAGDTSFGGSSTVGGKSSGGKGGSGKAGGSKGGSAGTAGVAGAGGTTGTCRPRTTVCVNNGVAPCDANGTPGPVKPCPPNQMCVQDGDSALCVRRVCEPGTTQCDVTGTLVEACSVDGTNLSTIADCGERGQLCIGGACRSLTCRPNELFCDASAVMLCGPNGIDTTLWQACGAGEYCDPLSLSCVAGLCAPGQPVCSGNTATLCNDRGSGYLGGGVDCTTMDRLCVLGACVCSPNLADCDGTPRNGCETNVYSDPDNCGTCGVVCSSNHVATRRCGGQCDGECSPGYADCNGDKLKDGCEAAIGTDARNCGGCGVSCSNNHVRPSCSSGVCSGACETGFADCNGDKQGDGCEIDTRSDVANCGGCGLSCSNEHVKAQCTRGVCSGACAAGYADCNGDKQSDGCEIDIQTDPQNCGGCGLSCAAGESCSAGKCSSRLTFAGIAQNLPVASLSGWSLCYAEEYGFSATTIEEVKKTCAGSLVMLACRVKGSTTLQLAAYAPRSDVFFDTGAAGSNVVHPANGVGWYHSPRYSWGFAPENDPVTRSSCDIEDSSIKNSGVDGQLRLCWHTSDDRITGGWRCGRNDNLNGSTTYERLMFTAD